MGESSVGDRLDIWPDWGEGDRDEQGSRAAEEGRSPVLWHLSCVGLRRHYSWCPVSTAG